MKTNKFIGYLLQKGYSIKSGSAIKKISIIL